MCCETFQLESFRWTLLFICLLMAFVEKEKFQMLQAVSCTISIKTKVNFEHDDTISFFPIFPGSIVPSILKLELADMETAARDCTTNQPSAR